MSLAQRESPILGELCTLLVEDIYGQLAARVFSVLARHGRQTLSALARVSYLSGRQLKYGLVILLQQHLIYYAENDATVAFYEIDWRASYGLVRLGKISKMIEDRYGKKAANIVSNLQTLGHTRIGDLKQAYFPPDHDSDSDSDDEQPEGAGSKRKRANGTQPNGTVPTSNGAATDLPAELNVTPLEDVMNNGGPVNGVSDSPQMNGSAKENGKIDSHQGSTHSEIEEDLDEEAEFYDLLRLLVQQGWICSVSDLSYLSPGEQYDECKQKTLLEVTGGGPVSGPKVKEAYFSGLRRRLEEARDEFYAPPNLPPKRKNQDSHYNGSTKRIKITAGRGQAVDHISHPEDDEVIRINPEKIAVALRTDHLVRLVEQRLGWTTAQVYKTMLWIVEANIPRCFDELSYEEEDMLDRSMLVTSRDIAGKLSKDVDIFGGLDPQAIVSVTKRGRVIQSSNTLSEPIDPFKLKMDEKTQLVDKHMMLLAEDPLHFITWQSRAGFSQWRIEFHAITKQIIHNEIENTISARKGALGVKLIRALKKKGRLDERAAGIAMMMSAADIRGIITDLAVQGFVQIQEIPKVDRREAKHSMHLVWYDKHRAREKLLHDTYKGMVRILERITFEREKVQALLAKAERSDVVGNEEKWLSKGELEALRKWREVQETLLLQLFREDDLVATLRDYELPFTSA